MGVERKTFKLVVNQVGDQGIFDGYASVFGNLDEQGDIVDRGAFTKTIQENPKVPVIWQHKASEPIGVTLEMTEDPHGLKVQGQINLDVARGKEAYSLLKQGALRGLSIGYDVVKKLEEVGARRLKELRLWEISLVTFPANPRAVVVGVKDNEEEDEGTDEDTKAGRVLSAANRLLLRQAFDAIQALLAVAEPPAGTPAEDEPKKPPEPDTGVSFDTLLREMQDYANRRRAG